MRVKFTNTLFNEVIFGTIIEMVTPELFVIQAERILTYKILLDKFNSKYSNFSIDKKLILKEFINSVDNTNKLKEFYNTKINSFKNSLVTLNKKTKNPVTKIKINEVTNLLVELNKNEKINIIPVRHCMAPNRKAI